MWKSVMDSLAGWEAPIVVRRESGEAQYATGVHLSRLALGTSLP